MELGQNVLQLGGDRQAQVGGVLQQGHTLVGHVEEDDPQPSASVFVKNWNSASYDRACVHGFIDGNDGTIYQCLPWNHPRCAAFSSRDTPSLDR